jgi:hypothetical protein
MKEYQLEENALLRRANETVRELTQSFMINEFD